MFILKLSTVVFILLCLTIPNVLSVGTEGNRFIGGLMRKLSSSWSKSTEQHTVGGKNTVGDKTVVDKNTVEAKKHSDVFTKWQIHHILVVLAIPKLFQLATTPVSEKVTPEERREIEETMRKYSANNNVMKEKIQGVFKKYAAMNTKNAVYKEVTRLFVFTNSKSVDVNDDDDDDDGIHDSHSYEEMREFVDLFVNKVLNKVMTVANGLPEEINEAKNAFILLNLYHYGEYMATTFLDDIKRSKNLTLEKLATKAKGNQSLQNRLAMAEKQVEEFFQNRLAKAEKEVGVFKQYKENMLKVIREKLTKRIKSHQKVEAIIAQMNKDMAMALMPKSGQISAKEFELAEQA